ncbi:MAG: glycosyltransferase family 2 protein [Desulfovibrionaceae bacterium]|nr:glycosyltransferase family 2 protein [Desulfovibrionaceae bacterium]
MPDVSIIIPVHNKWELTRACLRSLAEHSRGTECEVIVVDNASSDDSPAACPALGESLFGARFHYQRFEENRNFGPACNAGAALADSDLLFFLNNDTLLTPGWLPPLLEALTAESGLAAVGPLLVYPDETVQHLGIVISPAGASMGHLYAGLSAGHPLARRRRRFPAITGAALMLPRALFLEEGGFWEEYANGFEDVDLCLSLAKKGRAMSVVPESRVIHLESQTPERRARDVDNGRLLRTRHDLSRFANMHTLADEDGLALRVEADLQVRFAVPEERRRELLLRARAARSSRGDLCLNLLKLLEDEPFWDEGWAMLAALLEGEGRREEALALWFRYLRLSPSLDAAEQAVRLMRALGMDASDLSADVARWHAGILDEEAYAARLAGILSLLRRDGPRSLIPAYERAAARAAELRARLRAAARRQS